MKNYFKRIYLILICALCASVWSLPMFGWGQEGHRIIAQIAYDNLSSNARKQVDKTLGKHGMIYYANWADEIKSDNIYPNSYDWHFQDFEGDLSDSIVADALNHYPLEGGNMYRTLDSLEWEMAAERVSITNAIHVLRFYVHLSGDRYCPMHMAHMSDKGGNMVKMAWFSQQPNTNLHEVWDTKLIESQGYSYTEYARMLEDEYKDSKRIIEKMSDEQLLLDSYHLTQAIYRYQETWDGNTYHYIYTWRQSMERQLYIAGIRLAQKLNAIYK